MDQNHHDGPLATQTDQTPTISQHEPLAETDSTKQPPTVVNRPSSQVATCDRCSKSIDSDTVRMRCRKCPDFDYCLECFTLSKYVHPGHGFVAFHGLEMLPTEQQQSHLVTAQDRPPVEFPLRIPATDAANFHPECKACTSLAGQLCVFPVAHRDPQFYDAYMKNDTLDLSLSWYVKMSRVVEGAALGCAFCTYFLDAFFGSAMIQSWSSAPSSPWYLELEKKRDDLDKLLTTVMDLMTKLPHDRLSFQISRKFSKHKSNLPTKVKIGLNQEQDKGVPDKGVTNRLGVAIVTLDVYEMGDPGNMTFAVSQPPNPHPGSEKGLSWARSCLSECIANHGQDCSPYVQGEIPLLPSRLIDIASQDHLRLYEATESQRGRYCALSYVWGQKENFVTTKATCEELKSGFNLHDLPQTLQDAVTVARALGVQYLWADAVCIIQDDPDDKAREVAQMIDIYRNAEVTIVAAQASNVNQGFLKDHADPVTGLWKSIMPMPHLRAHPDAKTVIEARDMEKQNTGTLWLTEEFTRGIDAGDRDPVSRRAWCLQERLLSSRLLTYGRWPTWKCNKSMLSDGGFYLSHGGLDHKRNQLSQVIRRHWEKGTSTADVFSSYALLKIWRETVRDYSKRDMTDPLDIFPAIGGIAAYIGQVMGRHNYVAGLWENNLLSDLMWTAQGQEWLSRPDVWRAPTWSWAGVDGPITYADIDIGAIPLATARLSRRNPLRNESDKIEPADFGLQLIGYFREVPRSDLLKLLDEQNMSPPPPKSNDLMEWDRLWIEHIANELRSKFTLDTSDGVNDTNKCETIKQTLTKPVFAMITFSQDYRIRYEDRQDVLCYCGLLLQQVAGERYERVGSFIHEVRPWLEIDSGEWEKTTIEVQ